MKRFLALLTVLMLLGTACAEFAAPVDAPVSEVEVSLDSPAMGAATVTVNPSDLRSKADILEAAGDKEGAEILRRQADIYEEMEKAAAAQSLPKPGQNVSLTLGVKESVTLPSEGIVYKAADAKVLTVKGGKLMGKKAGTTTVTATVAGMEPVSFKVKVAKAPSKVTLSAKSLTLCLGEKRALKATLPKGSASAIAFTGSDSAVAFVDATGNVIALKAGTATITAKTFNKKKATCKVTVLNGFLPTSLTVEPTLNVTVKGKATLAPAVNAGAATVYSYTVKNKKIATVSAKGVVTGVKAGTTTVTVKTHNGLTATVNVTVAKKAGTDNKAITELTDLVGMNLETAVKKLGGKTKDLVGDGKTGTEYSSYKKNGVTISGPTASQYKNDKYYKKVNWIVLEKANKYTVLGIKPGESQESVFKKLLAAGFSQPSISYGRFSCRKEGTRIYVAGYLNNGKLAWIQYSVS